MDRCRLSRWGVLVWGMFLAAAVPSARAGWSYAPWTGDADSGIDSRYTYTCAVNCNGAAVAINGVQFDAHGGTTANGNGFSLGGAIAANGSRTTSITGSSATLANNGFIYSGNPRTLTLRGLTVGKTYRTTLFAFAYDADAGLRGQVFNSNGERVQLSQNLYGINKGITIDYTFVADAETRLLSITPTNATYSFHMSAFANCEVPAPPSYWSSSAWTGDADSGISSQYTYTCAVNFNYGAGPTTINGVAFDAHNGSARSGTGWSVGATEGWNAYPGAGGNLHITGAGATMGNPFMYNAFPRTVTVTGLTPGRRYTTTFYAFAWDAAVGSRIQTFASGSDSTVIDQDAFGQYYGIRMSYTFVADSTTRNYTITPASGNSFHMSGLSNRETLPSINPADFSRRMAIAFDGYTGTETLTNFPVLVKLADGVNGFDASPARSDGADLRFTEGDGTTQLDYEVEQWNPAGTSYVWVRLPTLTSATTIYAYWGNDNLGRAPESQADGSVWLADYAAVWHLNQVDGAAKYGDSTTGDHQGTANGSPYAAAGVIADGRRFDTSDGGDYVSVPYAAGLNLHTFSLTAWVKLASEPGNYGIMGSRIPADIESFDLKVSTSSIHGDFGNGTSWISTSVDINSGDVGSNGQGGDLAVGTWYQVTYVIDDDAKAFRLYLDGDLKRTIDYASTGKTPLLMQSGQTLYIGDDYASHEYMNGTLDELRIGSVARSSDWVAAAYLNQASNDVFATYGTAEQPGVDPIGDAIQRQDITFENYAGGQTLTNFPVLVQFAQGVHGFDYARCASGGTDLRFAADDGVTPLAYEIEEWDTGGTSYVWVRVPELSAATSIRALWGSGRTLPAACHSDGSVWSQDYVGVWHLDEVAGVEDLSDATAYGNDPTTDANTDNVTGRIAMGQNFDGADYISVPDSRSLSVKGSVTLSAWVNGSDFMGSRQIVAKDANLAYRARIDGGTSAWMLIYNAGGYDVKSTGYSFSLGTWYHVTAQFDAGTQVMRFFVNGVQYGGDIATTKSAIDDSAGALLIGAYSTTAERFAGIMDEVRISAAVRPADWVNAEWLNVASNGDFNTYGAVEANQPPALDNASGATNILASSAYMNGTLTSDGGGTTAVRLYYGTSDGLGETGDWDLNGGLGSDVSVGALTTNVTGLSSDTTYYYRFRASNSFAVVWAAPSKSFYTHLGAAQTPSNVVATTGIERTIDLTWDESAVHATGFVVEYWKTAGGATNRLVVSGGDATATTIWSLDHNTEYAFRVAATNDAIGDASPFSAAAMASTIPEIDAVSAADRCMRITFPNFTGATLTNFPVLVVLSDGSNGFNLADCQVGGTDLRFTREDGVTLLNHEIESWGADSTNAYVWVQVPTLNAATIIWAYWGSPKPYYAPCQTNGAVWSQNYVGVWHLDETDGVEDLTDSTAFANNATVDDNTDNAPGRVAKAQFFDGGTDYISIPDSASLSVTSDLTLEAWMNAEAFPSGAGLTNQNIIAKDQNNAYRFRVQDGGTLLWLLLKDAGALEVESVPYTFATGAWYHVAAKADFTTHEVRFYVNGSQVGAAQTTTKTGISDSAGPLLIGNYSAGRWDEDFDGTLDEVRVTQGLRSADWLHASWLTVASNTVFTSYDEALDLVPNAPRVLIIDGATNVLDVSAYLTATLSSTGGATTAVALFWGTNNAASAWDEWTYTNDLGTVGTPPPVDYTTFVNSLTPATRYYYAYRATNDYGTAWLGATFKTAGRPELDHGAGAVPGVGYAVLNGDLIDTNKSPTSVTVFWGPTDGGDVRTAWAYTNAMGVLENGAFATNTSVPLLYGVTYHYRCYATNGYGDTWSAATESFNSLMPREDNGWDVNPWTGDGDSDISNAFNYTVAVNLAGAALTINGASFQAHALSGPNFSVNGMPSSYTEYANAVSGVSSNMAKDFRLGGKPGQVVLSNLVAGTQYRTSFYGAGFGSVGTRQQVFNTSGDMRTVDENMYGSGNGIRISYTFMGDATGTRAFSISPVVVANTFHLSGLANREVAPLVGIRNDAVSDITESTATFNGTLSGTGAVFAVYVYWGATDGGTNTGDWAHSDYVGTYTNELAADLVYPASSLPIGTSYYTFRAVNPLVSIWAEPSVEFACLGQPTIDNLPADGAIGSATLNGDLTGGGIADVTVYWGATDGGDVRGAWAHTNVVGEVLQTTFATNTTTGLLYGKTYYYRCYATNAIGDDWADATATFLTLSPSQPTGWTTNQWNDDATADISSAHHYNVAVNLGGVAIDVNGVSFGASALSGDNFTISGLGSIFNNDANTVTGTGSDVLANDFRYGGNPGIFAILNLTPGQYYRTTFYGVGFGAVGDRVQTFSAEGDDAEIDEHQYGNNNGMRASYTFQAGAATKTYTVTPKNVLSTFHTYALSNREIPMDDTLAVMNDAATAIATDSATLNGRLFASNAVFDVYAYWGTSNAVDDAGAWQHSALVGAYSDEAGVALSVPVATLADNTQYYFTFQATNAAGDVWGLPVRDFWTLGGAVVSNLSATGVTVASATLNGELVNGTSADVSILWGLSDGGAAFGGWDHTNVVGTVGVGTFATSVTVRAGGTYYYRCYATNAYGYDWADSTQSFNTPQATLSIADASVTEGDAGTVDAAFDVTLSAACASNVTVNFAAVSGTAVVGTDVVASNGTLRIDAGETSGQIIVRVIGDTEEEQLSEAFAVELSGVAGGATIGDGSATCTVEDDDLGMENVRYKMKIVFAGYTKAETLTNFPVLVEFGTNLNNFGYDQFESTTAGDLRFGNADETRFLNYEIEEWDTNGQSYVWVQVPELADSSSYIWAYWGNEDDTVAPPCTTNGTTWRSDYGAVWHLDAINNIEDLTDSTMYGLDATDNGDSHDVVGRISHGQSFDGGDWLTAVCPAALAGNVDFTVSSWVKHSATASRAWMMTFGVRNNLTAYHALINTDGKTQLGIWGGYQNQPNILAYRDTWVHMTTVHTAGNTIETYLDGVLVDSDAATATPNINPAGGVNIGQKNGSESDYIGVLDEIRLSSAARSSNWVWACWFNQASNMTFNTYETVRARPRGASSFILR